MRTLMRNLVLCFLLAAIALSAGQTPTFSRDVAEIIYNNCASCHREGEAGPLTLTGYKDVVKRGPLIATVTQSR